MTPVLLHAPAAIARGRPAQLLRHTCAVRRACYFMHALQCGASADKRVCTRRSRAPFGGVRAAWSAPPQRAQQKPQPGPGSASDLAWYPLAAALLASLPATAEEAPSLSAPPGGINVAEIAILAAPLILYGVFNVYRDRLNPNAKVGLPLACRGVLCETETRPWLASREQRTERRVQTRS